MHIKTNKNQGYFHAIKLYQNKLKASYKRALINLITKVIEKYKLKILKTYYHIV